jgi:hypothetical protein
MDPYLESPDWFPGLHSSLITFMKGALQRSLPGSYYAESDQRVWLEYSQRPMEPDVEIVHPAPKRRKRRRGDLAVLPESREGGPLVVTVETIEDGPFKELYLEIRQRRGQDVQVVTSIEVLSPTNKKSDHPAHEKYVEKQRKTLNSETHLVEIDLLRGGTYTLAVPRNLVKARAGGFDYLVSIHRFNRPQEFLVYPIGLAQRLPVIDIPLLPGDADVTLDLQEVFHQAYDVGPYRKGVVYGKDPIVPRLTPDQSKWAADWLKQHGRRA